LNDNRIEYITNKTRTLIMRFSNNNTTMLFRTGTQKGEEYIKLHTGGYPESTIHKGCKETFRKETGIITFEKRGKVRLSERQIKLLNDFLNKQ